MASEPVPQDGAYLAGDDLQFLIGHKNGAVCLRFQNSDEVFYLTSEPAPLGGRVLKYDTGDVALQVTGWGGVTVYTPQAKAGIPAERSEGSEPVDPMPVAAGEMKAFAAKLAQQLATQADFAIGFTANWDAIQSDELRALAADAMRDATYALQQVARDNNRLSDRVHIVRIVSGAKPGALLQKGVLTVTVAPRGGPAARPSSLVIARALDAGL